MENQYFAKEIGTHLFAALYEIPDEKLKNTNQIYNTIINSLKEDGFHIKKKFIYKVRSPKDYYAISIDIIFLESGLQFSTYPEYNSAILDFHSCRGKNDGQKIYNDLCSYLEPKIVLKQINSLPFSYRENLKENLEGIVEEVYYKN